MAATAHDWYSCSVHTGGSAAFVLVPEHKKR